jgi:hypothetical protein
MTVALLAFARRRALRGDDCHDTGRRGVRRRFRLILVRTLLGAHAPVLVGRDGRDRRSARMARSGLGHRHCHREWVCGAGMAAVHTENAVGRTVECFAVTLDAPRRAGVRAYWMTTELAEGRVGRRLPLATIALLAGAD